MIDEQTLDALVADLAQLDHDRRLDLGSSALVNFAIEAIRALREQVFQQRQVGHAEGQSHAIDDVNAGRVDDLIAPRLQAEQARADALATEVAEANRAVEQITAILDAERRMWLDQTNSLRTEHARLRAALEIIVECKARFSLDPLEHARTAVQYCRDHASAALLAASQEEK